MADGAKEVPKGQRFTHVYVERGKPTQDSARMRRRFASLIDSIGGFHGGDSEPLSARAERELGNCCALVGERIVARFFGKMGPKRRPRYRNDWLSIFSRTGTDRCLWQVPSQKLRSER